MILVFRFKCCIWCECFSRWLEKWSNGSACCFYEKIKKDWYSLFMIILSSGCFWNSENSWWIITFFIWYFYLFLWIILLELIDSDDEVLVVMAEQLGIHFFSLLCSWLHSTYWRNRIYWVHSWHSWKVVYYARSNCSRCCIESFLKFILGNQSYFEDLWYVDSWRDQRVYFSCCHSNA